MSDSTPAPTKSLFQRMMQHRAPIGDLIGFESLEAGDGRAIITLQSGPQHFNPMGTLHGGVLCDIADTAMGFAFASTLAPERIVHYGRTQNQLFAAGSRSQTPRRRPCHPARPHCRLCRMRSHRRKRKARRQIQFHLPGPPWRKSRRSLACSGDLGTSPFNCIALDPASLRLSTTRRRVHILRRSDDDRGRTSTRVTLHNLTAGQRLAISPPAAIPFSKSPPCAINLSALGRPEARPAAEDTACPRKPAPNENIRSSASSWVPLPTGKPCPTPRILWKLSASRMKPA